MTRISFLLTLLLTLAGLILSACGGSTPAQSAASSQNQPAEAAPTQAPSGDPAEGQKIFTSTCAACHGPTGQGVTGLGKDMTSSEFIAEKTDQELVDFIKMGRDPSDPLNTTGVAMPVKGGNPALSDEDLFDVVSYIRTIHK